MDKNKAYCPECQKEMNWNNLLQRFEYNCDCYNNRKFNYILLYCEKCNKFTSRRGIVKGSLCCRCAVILQHKIMKENDPEGYSKRQANATKYANEKMKIEGKGVWGKEQHIKSEVTKRKNGTDLGNKEFREKIGCNGNPQEIIDHQKKLGIGIFRNDIRNNHKPGNCVKCGKFCEHRNAFGIGIECDCLNKQLIKEKEPKFCEKCQKVTPHNGNACLVCHPESKCIGISSFKTENNILYYYDKSTKSYIPWEDYKNKFNRKRLTKDLESFINSLKSLDIFQPKQMGPVGSYDLNDVIQVVPTFRTQDSKNWEGARIAFEQYLIDNKIDWFTYIKLYIKNNNIRPLVVGKSGSLNVNNSGSDISFSTDINDGPARRFLYDINASWDKTRILIIKAKSEQQALYYEYKISNIYNLFES